MRCHPEGAERRKDLPTSLWLSHKSDTRASLEDPSARSRVPQMSFLLARVAVSKTTLDGHDHLDQAGDRISLHLVEDFVTTRFHGAETHAHSIGDPRIGFAVDHEVQHLSFLALRRAIRRRTWECCESIR